MTDLSGYAKKSTANGDTRSGLRLRLRIAVPGRAADADPPQHLTWIVDQHPSALGHDRVVGGVPRDAKPLGDASDA